MIRKLATNIAGRARVCLDREHVSNILDSSSRQKEEADRWISMPSSEETLLGWQRLPGPAAPTYHHRHIAP